MQNIKINKANKCKVTCAGTVGTLWHSSIVLDHELGQFLEVSQLINEVRETMSKKLEKN